MVLQVPDLGLSSFLLLSVTIKPAVVFTTAAEEEIGGSVINGALHRGLETGAWQIGLIRTGSSCCNFNFAEINFFLSLKT